MKDCIFVLGAADPEMEEIEVLLTSAGVPYVYATRDGKRVHPGNAYRCDPIETHASNVYLVECARDPVHTGRRLMSDAPEGVDPESEGYRYWWETHIDHHRPGDPGYGRPPNEFLAASSIGQVISVLADQLDYLEALSLRRGAARDWLVRGPLHSHVIPIQLIMTAAADHCLGAAYRGECPGVDPDELMRFRAEQRARFQGRDVSEVLADIGATTEAIATAKWVLLDETFYGCDRFGQSVEWSGYPEVSKKIFTRDMRRESPWPELPEAATRAGVSYISGPLDCPDGRKKITCSGTREVVFAFMTQWALSQGLTDIYGDPARGFAGGYLP